MPFTTIIHNKKALETLIKTIPGIKILGGKISQRKPIEVYQIDPDGGSDLELWDMGRDTTIKIELPHHISRKKLSEIVGWENVGSVREEI